MLSRRHFSHRRSWKTATSAHVGRTNEENRQKSGGGGGKFSEAEQRSKIDKEFRRRIRCIVATCLRECTRPPDSRCLFESFIDFIAPGETGQLPRLTFSRDTGPRNAEGEIGPFLSLWSLVLGLFRFKRQTKLSFSGFFFSFFGRLLSFQFCASNDEICPFRPRGKPSFRKLKRTARKKVATRTYFGEFEMPFIKDVITLVPLFTNIVFFSTIFQPFVRAVSWMSPQNRQSSAKG